MADSRVRFSLCVPSFNHGARLGEAVLSVLGQEGPTCEVWVSDNASGDGSVEVVAALDDDRVHVRVNRTNIGFAGNLDRAVRPSSGEWVVLMPADGRMEPGALRAYDALAGATGTSAVVTSRAWRVDESGRHVGSLGPDLHVWRGAPVNRPLSDLIGRRVLELDAATALGRSLSTMRNPLSSRSTAYPRKLYDEVGGYLGARTVHPEKWFHWRLLSVAERVYFIDDELFSYQPQRATGPDVAGRAAALKVLVDDYVSSFELGPTLLERSGLEQREVERAFVEHDIARHGLASLARGERLHARRISSFGLAAYPTHARRNPRWWLLRALTSLGSAGEATARAAYVRSSAASHLP